MGAFSCFALPAHAAAFDKIYRKRDSQALKLRKIPIDKPLLSAYDMLYRCHDMRRHLHTM